MNAIRWGAFVLLVITTLSVATACHGPEFDFFREMEGGIEDAVVISLDQQELCVSFDGTIGKDCIERKRVFNLSEPYPGHPAVIPEDSPEQVILGRDFRIVEVKKDGEKGVILVLIVKCPEEETEGSNRILPPPPPLPVH